MRKVVSSGWRTRLPMSLIATFAVWQSNGVCAAQKPVILAPAPQENVIAAGLIPLDLEQAVALAVDNDPVSQQIRWQIEQATGERYQATRLPNPVASVIGNEIGNAGNGGQYGLQWSQDVVRNNRPELQQRYYNARICALEQQLQVRYWQMVFDTTSRYAEVFRRRQEQTVLAGQLQQLNSLAEIVQALFKAGEISKVDTANIDIELRILEQQISELELTARAQLRALAVPLGFDAMNGDSLPEVHFPWDQTVAEILATSPEVDENWILGHPQRASAEARMEQERRGIGVARSERMPDIQVQGSINYDQATEDVFAAFQVGVPLLRNDNKSGLIHSATARYQESCEQLRRTEMALRQKAAIQAGEVARYQSRVQNLKDVVIPAAEKNLEQIRDAFRIGEASYLMLKTGFETLIQSRQRLVEAEYELILSSARLKTLLLDE
jgi:outer membrane protein, heavy metal efflux system